MRNGSEEAHSSNQNGRRTVRNNQTDHTNLTDSSEDDGQEGYLPNVSLF